MSTVAIIGGVFLAIGVVANIACFLRYSNFLDQLLLVDPKLVDPLAIKAGEGGSKNASITMYFWNEEYISLPNVALHKLGDSVRNSGLTACASILAGMALLAIAN